MVGRASAAGTRGVARPSGTAQAFPFFFTTPRVVAGWNSVCCVSCLPLPVGMENEDVIFAALVWPRAAKGSIWRPCSPCSDCVCFFSAQCREVFERAQGCMCIHERKYTHPTRYRFLPPGRLCVVLGMGPRGQSGHAGYATAGALSGVPPQLEGDRAFLFCLFFAGMLIGRFFDTCLEQTKAHVSLSGRIFQMLC